MNGLLAVGRVGLPKMKFPDLCRIMPDHSITTYWHYSEFCGSKMCTRTFIEDSASLAVTMAVAFRLITDRLTGWIRILLGG